MMINENVLIIRMQNLFVFDFADAQLRWEQFISEAYPEYYYFPDIRQMITKTL